MTATEQPVLLLVDDDSALLFSDDQRKKRFTGTRLQALEWKKNAVLMLIASDWPVEVISQKLGVCHSTVRALAKRSAEEVSGFNKQFGEILMRTGARWIGLARTKEDTASFRDLTIGAGIVMQHARETLLMGEMAGEKVLKEDVDHVQAAAALRQIMEAEQIPLPAPDGPQPATIDSGSGETELIPEQTPTLPVPGAGAGAVEEPIIASADTGPGRPDPDLAARFLQSELVGGGGSEQPTDAAEPMPPRAQGFPANGPSASSDPSEQADPETK